MANFSVPTLSNPPSLRISDLFFLMRTTWLTASFQHGTWTPDSSALTTNPSPLCTTFNSCVSTWHLRAYVVHVEDTQRAVTKHRYLMSWGWQQSLCGLEPSWFFSFLHQQEPTSSIVYAGFNILSLIFILSQTPVYSSAKQKYLKTTPSPHRADGDLTPERLGYLTAP